MPVRVLIVDDHPMIVWALTKLMESEPDRFEVAGTALTYGQALQEATRLQPDVILLDLDFPEETTLDMIPLLVRSTEAKVLVFTGVRDEELQDRAIMLGARGVVCKGMPLDKVLNAVEGVSAGELWLDGTATARVFEKLKRGQNELPAQHPFAALSIRERQVVSLIADQGAASSKQLARHLNISERTLRNYLTTIYSKLGVKTRFDLFLLTQKSDWLQHNKTSPD